MIRRIPMGEYSQVNALPPLYAVLCDSVKATGEDFGNTRDHFHLLKYAAFT